MASPRILPLVLVAACAPGSATYTCAKAWTFDTGVQAGEYTVNTLDCDTYRGEGDQIRNGDEVTCEADGLALGAIDAECTCSTWTVVRCPGDVND